jgi:succinate-semialdehyde dehydrogenase/glutarate-semialdehyde dehydrogenase
MSDTVQSINPANGQVVETYDKMTIDNAFQIIDAVDKTQQSWRTTSFDYRAQLMNKAADVLEANKDKYARLMMDEMGKIYTQGVAEVEKCAWVCRYYAEKAEAFLADEVVETDMDESLISYQPIGVVLAVMPWNYPFWQVFRFAAPTLMAGNAGVLKHASSVTGCSLAIEDVFKQAGFPDDVFRSLIISGSDMEDVIEHDKIRAVTLTGSTKAGQSVASTAGQLLKKTVLELGGSDPYLILHDADIQLAAKTCVDGRLLNSGQSCIAAKRFIVVDAIYDEFLDAFKSEMVSRKMGAPENDDTDIGPQSSTDLRDELHDQVKRSVDAGATCILGGEIPKKDGAWYPATILTDVKEGMPAYEEELFGPVAIVIRASDEDEAIRIANDSNFGLGGGVFTTDIERGTMIARDKIDSGAVFVNSFTKSDPRMPFGGVKQSGYGRELSRFGIREFVNIKAVGVNKG